MQPVQVMPFAHPWQGSTLCTNRSGVFSPEQTKHGPSSSLQDLSVTGAKSPVHKTGRLPGQKNKEGAEPVDPSNLLGRQFDSRLSLAEPSRTLAQPPGEEEHPPRSLGQSCALLTPFSVVWPMV